MKPWNGVEELTKKTLNHLQYHGFQVLWAAAQNNAASIKVERELNPKLSLLSLLLIALLRMYADKYMRIKNLSKLQWNTSIVFWAGMLSLLYPVLPLYLS